MNEYDRADAAFYDHVHRGLRDDVQFYVEEARKAGSPVLELGCGTGRVMIPVAEAGIPIVGLDRAPAMLAIARQKVAKLSAETQRRIEIIEGDMRSFTLGRRFDLITIPFRAFLHLLTSEDQRQALGCIREHLSDDGRLIFNVFDPRLDIIAAHFGSLGTAVKKQSEFVHPDTGHRVLVWDSRQYDPGRQMLESYFIFEELDDEGKVIAKTYSPLILRYVYRYEMQYLLELCGYRVEALYGDFQRGPFRYGGEQIWVARRAAEKP
ncbi:MAG: class I SAM-dependent methyltransferase [Planctomycetes bacterium]|nr:class I SAM-dependent methyltransferase [Planctomycetota bacterium]